MTDKTQDTLPFEFQTVLDYVSIPDWINTESHNYDSRNPQSKTDTSLEQDDSKLQGPLSDLACSSRQSSEYQHSNFDPAVSRRSMSEYQHSTFDPAFSRRSMREQRTHSFSSWCALLNIQHSDSQKNSQNDMKSGMRPLFRSLLTVVPFGNTSSGATGKADTFTTSVAQSFKYIHNVPGESFKHVHKDSYKDIHTDSFGDTPSDFLSDISINSFTEVPNDSFKDSATDSVTDVSSVLIKDINLNLYKGSLRDSMKNINVESLKDIPEVSLKDTQRSSLSEYKTDLSSTDVAPKSEDTLDVKQPQVSDDNTAVPFPADHELMETTPSLTQRPQTSTAKQEPPLPQSTSVSLLGVLVNYLFIGPCVLAFWNSTWCFLDYALLDHDCQMSFWVSAVMGFPCLVAATLLQNSLSSYSAKCNNFVRFIISRTYTYIVSVACVSHWRSVWTIAYCYVDISLFNSALTFVTVFLVLLLSRCLVCTLAPPVSIAMELTHAEHYKRDTFWRKTASCSLDALFDTIISVFGIHSLSSTYWRSAWEILDLCLIPDDQYKSAIWSVGVSIGLGGALLAVQRPVMELSRYLQATHWLLMLIFQDLISVLYSIVCITYWRGVWMLLDLYTPFRPNSLYIAHGVSFGILVVCLSANSLLVRNVDRDGGVCISFDVSFVATLIQTLRRKTDTKYRTELLLNQRQCPDGPDHL